MKLKISNFKLEVVFINLAEKFFAYLFHYTFFFKNNRESNSLLFLNTTVYCGISDQFSYPVQEFMLKNYTLKNGTSHNGLYGRALLGGGL